VNVALICVVLNSYEPKHYDEAKYGVEYCGTQKS
jgi:hypothetical protein